MALLQVLHFPDERLRKKAVPVARVDDSVRKLASDMLETMYAERGVGLAATQVNVQQRVVVIDVSEEGNAPMVLVNPEVIAEDGSAESQEGCLSVPGYFDTVSRAERIAKAEEPELARSEQDHVLGESRQVRGQQREREQRFGDEVTIGDRVDAVRRNDREAEPLADELAGYGERAAGHRAAA